VVRERTSSALQSGEGSRALAQFDQALVFEFGIRFDNSVWAHNELFCQTADTRKLVAVLQGAGLGGVPNLLHQLQINRLAGDRIEPEQHAIQL